MPRKKSRKLSVEDVSPQKPTRKTPSPTFPTVQPLSPIIDSPSPPSSSHTPTASTSNDHLIQWIYQDRRPHSFVTEISPITGIEVTKFKVFELNDLVVDFYLRADAHAHTIRVQLSSDDIESIKKTVRSASNHLESNYRWPFDGNIAKFTSKDSKQKLASDFEPILDARGIDLKSFNGTLQDLTINDVVEGARVSVEYIPVPYGGKKPNKKDDGFMPGSTLKLISIAILEKPANLDTNISPSKRRRVT